jgi:hypothetical protein
MVNTPDPVQLGLVAELGRAEALKVKVGRLLE